MRMIGDMSSILWTCLLAGKADDATPVEHNGRTVYVNSYMHGYEATVNRIEAALREYKLAPIDFVMVFEGRDSKQRRVMIDNTYKANREGDKDSRPPEAYVEFNKLKELIRNTYHDLGAISVSQPFVEGDDVIAYLTDNAEEDTLVLTGDNDLAVLNRVNKYGAKTLVRIGDQVGINKYGDFSFKYITLYKALVGDSSDNIKGVPGFGPNAWLNIIARYDEDGCQEIEDLLRQGKRDELAVFADDNKCKFLQKIVDNWTSAVKCLQLTTLHPEWVNTVRLSLDWQAGIALRNTNDERLQDWVGARRLVTADNYDDSLARLKSQLERTPHVGFDIETAMSDEAIEWLQEQGDPSGLDVLGSYITGFSVNFGRNLQYTYYVSLDHKNTNNVSMVQGRELLEACFGKPIVIANTSFELSVLYANCKDEDGTMWRDQWKKYGENGFIPNIRDIQLEASYVNENIKLGLKFRSEHHIGYQQISYDEVTQGGTLQMNQLTGKEVLAYGADDALCSNHLHNFYRLHMQTEHHYQVYLDVELDAAYQHALNYVQGANIDVARLSQLTKEDQTLYGKNWAILRAYLLKQGWEGTVPPTYTAEITPKEIKAAYAIVMGLDGEADAEDDEPAEDGEKAAVVKDPVLSTRVRTVSKFPALIAAAGHEEFATMLQSCLDGGHEEFTTYVRGYFTGEPKFKSSNKQMNHLLYEVMQLPIKVRNKPTATMLAAGIRQGNPKADALAISYALRDAADDPEKLAVLNAIKLMQMVRTRQSLYYSTYPGFIHWKDGKIHSSHRQSSTNTRRASSAKPNFQQLPKHPKMKGYDSEFRSIFVPHRSDAVIVSMDFNAQELRVIAEYSQDRNMLACYVGDNKKDMHALTGVGIMRYKDATNLQLALALLTPEQLQADVSEAEYQAFVALDSGTPEQKALFALYRALGKKVNFTTEYGAQAPKLAATMLIEEDEAQAYIDAREDAFPEAKEWKKQVVDEARSNGFVTTMLGARRHLAEFFQSDDRMISSKAERQAVNFKIQSSSAEMTKKAEGRMWKAGLFVNYDAVCYGPIHDEVVASVRICDLEEFLPKMHACMVAPYANMQVPIESSISFGKDFKTQHEIGSKPTAEAIKAGLAEMAEAA